MNWSAGSLLRYDSMTIMHIDLILPIHVCATSQQQLDNLHMKSNKSVGQCREAILHRGYQILKGLIATSTLRTTIHLPIKLILVVIMKWAVQIRVGIGGTHSLANIYTMTRTISGIVHSHHLSRSRRLDLATAALCPHVRKTPPTS